MYNKMKHNSADLFCALIKLKFLNICRASFPLPTLSVCFLDRLICSTGGERMLYPKERYKQHLFYVYI
jgi:hypothetical protein